MTDQISHATIFSFSNWSIPPKHKKYAGIFLLDRGPAIAGKSYVPEAHYVTFANLPAGWSVDTIVDVTSATLTTSVPKNTFADKTENLFKHS